MAPRRPLLQTLRTTVIAAAFASACVAAAAQSAGGPGWHQLSPAQRAALAPLERDWASIDADRKQKWLDIAERFPRMSPDERSRIQTRMADWARMTPAERGQARLRFQEARNLSAEERQQRWNAYQSLPPEKRRELAQRAAPPPKAAGNGDPRRAEAARAPREAGAPQAKSNIVPNPAYAAPPKAVAPTVVQARPGASTSLISRPPTPPAHQQTGLPKIAATPGFVDDTTLLPKRGPQGAAVVRPEKPAPARDPG